MIRLAIGLVATSLVTIMALASLVVAVVRMRRGGSHRRSAITSVAVASIGIAVCVGLAVALSLRAAKTGTGVARSVYHRVGHEIRTDSEGCPQAFPFDGSQKRLEVMSCTSPTNPNPHGVQLQQDAPVLDEIDDYLPISPDGKYAAIFQADESAVRAIVAAPPPWGDTWRSEPLDGPPLLEWFPAPNNDLFTSSTVQYAVDYLSSTPEFPHEHGNFLAIDTATNRVWFAYWDF